jgi:hypothetical protein
MRALGFNRNRIATQVKAMQLSIIGAGAVATALAGLWRAAGHDIVFGVRGPVRPDQVTISSAIAAAPVIVLATPYSAAVELAGAQEAALAGKIVIDVTNPINIADWSPLILGAETSGAETIASAAPRARTVKAFNTIFADVMRRERLAHSRVSAFVASDDEPAAETVAALARDAGFDPVLTGPLRTARYLEAMAHLNIAIAVGRGGGTNAAFFFDRPA